ncbi:DNA polymerase III subunit delta [Candidatus Pelagibacter sp.]|nr:DNA polymerase III subunit delta [Candidatus Pelagibacter sp.]
MILKSYEIKKINFQKNNLILFYGKNEALKDQAIKLINKNKQIFIFDEKEILENQNNFLETVTNKSLFEEERTILIKRASDKILKIIQYIYSKDLKDINIFVNSDELEKKSKLRSFFEKEKECICVPFYADNEQTLIKFTLDFFKEKNILISQYSINQIISKSLGDRKSLINELEKIAQFSKNKKKIEDKDIAKIINLTENYSITELVNNFLAKNKKKIVNILNENNYSNDDCVLIIRSFLNKSKKILKLSEEYEKNNNINITISNARPPIFWKEKEITIQQIQKWEPKKIKQLIYRLNELELNIKKNFNNSICLTTDFILEQST